MLLAVSVFQMTINDILPVTSDTIPLIGKSQYLCIDIGLNLHYTELNPFLPARRYASAIFAVCMSAVCMSVCLSVCPSVRPSHAVCLRDKVSILNTNRKTIPIIPNIWNGVMFGGID